MTLVSSKEFVGNQEGYFDLTLNEDVVIKRSRNRIQCQDWYGITDAEDNEEGIYSGDELVENAVNALRNYHEGQILKNRPKNSQ